MNLEDYLKGIRKIPDDELLAEFGIEDNISILINVDFDYVVGFLNENPQYREVGPSELEGKRVMRYTHETDQGVATKVMDYLTDFCLTGFGFGKGRKDEEYRRQKRDYRITVQFHPGSGDKSMGDQSRRIANAMVPIIQFILENNIPACITYFGHKYLEPFDFDRIVYHEPK